MSIALNYQTFGTGEPLLILHGLLGSGRNWHGIAKRLADHYRVITVDLRNHGNSDHADTMTYLDMANDVASLIDTAAPAPATIMGHSMGGKTAMVLALQRPELISSLLVIDIAPVDYSKDYSQLIAHLQALPLAEIHTRTHADLRLQQLIPDAELRQFLLMNMDTSTAPATWRININTIAESLHHVGEFPRALSGKVFDGPACFIAGSESDYILPEHHTLIRRMFPAAQIRIVEGAGHWIHADQPQALLDEVSGFLNQT